MDSSSSQVHVVVVPLMSQSHLIPMINLSKLLAQRSLLVTIILTPHNALKYKEDIDQATHIGLNVRLVSLKFPCSKVGLPDGCENLDALPYPDLQEKFFLATSLMQAPIESYLGQVYPKPSCLISGLPWTRNAALKLNIPRYAYQGISCFTLLCSHKIIIHKVLDDIQSDDEPFLVPDIPNKVEFTMAQLPKIMRRSDHKNSGGTKHVLDEMKDAELSADGLLINTFEELELEYVKSYQNVMRNVLCVGPLSLCTKVTNDYKLNEGNNDDKDSKHEHICLGWLDSMPQRSVIYTCFGSLCHLLPRQLIELGLGLEASNYPFIWIIREVDYKEELVHWLRKEKFEDRIRGRGLIIKGWAPQVLILSHPSIGGFLTHCGWNSILEGVSAGVPMITWPMFAEQFYNEKLLVQVLKIAVSIGVKVTMQWGEEQNNGVYVKKEDVKNAIEKLMDNDGQERRKKAQIFEERAREAIEDGGSSYLNITSFIQHVNELLKLKARET